MRYFAYGSNLDVIQMKGRCPDSVLLGKAVLKGHKLAFNRYSNGWECGVADILKDSKEKVWGLLFEISDSDLKKLDYYEGYPSFYRRIKVEVFDQNQVAQTAITYEVVTKEKSTWPSSEYLNIIKKAGKEHGFPEEYHKYLDSVEVQ